MRDTSVMAAMAARHWASGLALGIWATTPATSTAMIGAIRSWGMATTPRKELASATTMPTIKAVQSINQMPLPVKGCKGPAKMSEANELAAIMVKTPVIPAAIIVEAACRNCHDLIAPTIRGQTLQVPADVSIMEDRVTEM